MSECFGYAVRLFKKSGTTPFQFPDVDRGAGQQEGLCLYGYGYYDAVEILPLPSLLYATWESRDLPVGNDPENCQHQDILFQRVEPTTMDAGFSNHPFVCISFLQLEEDCSETSTALADVFACFRKIVPPAGIRVEIFYTLGSSAMGLLILPEGTGTCATKEFDLIPSAGDLFAKALQYLDKLRADANHLLDHEGVDTVRLLDTYSIFGFNRALLEKEQDELCAAYTQRLPYVSFNLHARAGADIQSFAEELHFALTGKRPLPTHCLIQTMGNEDFVLRLQDVPLGKLIAVSHPLGIRAEQQKDGIASRMHYLNYCYDFHTTIGLTSTAKGLGLFERERLHGVIFDYNAWAVSAGQLEEMGFRDLGSALHALADHLARLSASHFTKWIWESHRLALERFRTALIYSAQRDPGIAMRVGWFFNCIISALDCLAFTSSYSSENPGYHKLQDDYCSRLIIGYDRQLNALTTAWDDFNRRCKANLRMQAHLDATPTALQHAVLCSIDTMRSRVSMRVFDNVAGPGDVIFIQFPTLLAYQPFFTLPAMCHELGHAIGPRKRLQRIKYYTAIMADHLCNRILAHVLRANDDVRTPAGDQDILRRKGQSDNSYIVMALFAWRGVFRDRIQQILEKDGRMQCQKKNGSCPCTSCVWMKNYLRGPMCEAICHLIADETNWIARIVNDFKSHMFASKEVASNLYELLSDGWSAVCVDLMASTGNEYFRRAETLLDEPLSDYVMVNLCGCTASQYLQICFHLLRENQLCDNTVGHSEGEIGQAIQEAILDSRHLSRFLAVLDVVFGLHSADDVCRAGREEPIIFREPPVLQQYHQFVEVLAAQHEIYCAIPEGNTPLASRLRTFRMHYSTDAVRDYLKSAVDDPRMNATLYHNLQAEYRDAGMDTAQQAFESERRRMHDLFQAAWTVVVHKDTPELEWVFLNSFFHAMHKLT